MKEVLHTAYYDKFEISMTADQAKSCNHPGPCDSDVEALMPLLKLEHIEPRELREQLEQYGAWDDCELADHDTNLRRIVWIAAGDIDDGISDMERESEE